MIEQASLNSEKRIVLPPSAEVTIPVTEPILIYGSDEKPIFLEAQKAPSLVVDRVFKTVLLEHQDNRVVRFKGDLTWAVFMELANQPNQLVTNRHLTSVLSELQSSEANVPNRQIRMIRKQIEKDPENPQVVASSGNGRNSTYTLKADVRFVDSEKVAEEKVIPKIVVDESQHEVQIDGKTVQIPTRAWSVFIHFAQNPNLNISNETVRKLAEEAGYRGEAPDQSVITVLRRSFREAGLDSKEFLEADRIALHSFYQLNADVEFSQVSELLPKLEIIEGKNEVNIEGDTILLTDYEMRLLRGLSTKVGKKISSNQIAIEEFDAPKSRDFNLRRLIRNLMEKFNSHKNDLILYSGNRGAHTWMMLQGVQISYATVLTKEFDSAQSVQSNLDQLKAKFDNDRLMLIKEKFPEVLRDAQRFIDIVYENTEAFYEPWEYIGGDGGEADEIKDKYDMSFARHRPSRGVTTPLADLFCEVSEILIEQRVRQLKKAKSNELTNSLIVV